MNNNQIKFHKLYKPQIVVFSVLIIIIAISGIFAYSPILSSQQKKLTQNKNPQTYATSSDTASSMSSNAASSSASSDTASSAALSSATSNAPSSSATSDARAKKISPLKTLTHAINNTTDTANDKTGEIKTTSTIFVKLQVNNKRLETSMPANSTAYELMIKLRDENQLSFTAREFGGIGYFIEKIEGIENDTKEKKYWIYFVNGVKAKVGVSTYVLKTGDIVSWQYEKDENN